MCDTWTGSICVRTNTNGVLLWTWWCILRFHKIRGISWVAEEQKDCVPWTYLVGWLVGFFVSVPPCTPRILAAKQDLHRNTDWSRLVETRYVILWLALGCLVQSVLLTRVNSCPGPNRKRSNVLQPPPSLSLLSICAMVSPVTTVCLYCRRILGCGHRPDWQTCTLVTRVNFSYL